MNKTPSFTTHSLRQSLLWGCFHSLILIVLGSNLYPSNDIPPPSKHYNRILFGSLLSRMILPSAVLLPIIALCVKYIKASILDDPIFLIVAFILTVSPPAIQLSQITQLNNVYQKEMSGVLFWGLFFGCANYDRDCCLFLEGFGVEQSGVYSSCMWIITIYTSLGYNSLYNIRIFKTTFVNNCRNV